MVRQGNHHQPHLPDSRAALPPLLHRSGHEQVPGINHRLHEPRCFHVQRPDSYREDPDNPGKIQQARILFIKVYKKRANHCKVQ